MGILVLIVVGVLFLAIIGLGWNTFLEGVWKGANKIGIASILENATRSSTEIAKNASRDYSWKLTLVANFHILLLFSC